MQEISVRTFKEKIDSGENVYLLDVRDPLERYQADIDYPHGTLIPLDRLEHRLDEIKAGKNDEIICMCRSGGRSAEAAGLLEKQGFTNVKTLKGGINQWAREIDNTLPVY